MDLVSVPDGTSRGYEDLVEDAVWLSIDEQRVLVLSRRAWVALKQASGRAKDLQHLDQYYQRYTNP